MKRILVPTDYSSLSVNALDFAIDIAQASGAEIHLVHFLSVPIEPATFDELLQENRKERSEFVSDLELGHHKNRLKEIANELAGRGITILTAIGGNGVVRGAEKYVNSHSVDLIVLGADDVEEEKGEFPVSFSQELTQFVKIPVISLTEHVEYVDLSKVVLGIDPMKHSDLASLAKSVGPVLFSLDAHIYVVDVIKSEEKDREKRSAMLKSFSKDAQLQNYEVQVIEHENDLEGLLLYADKMDAGLVAVVSDGRPNIFRFFKDSFATSVVKATDLPVLVFNSKGSGS